MGLDSMILVFECWVLSRLFHSPLSPSSRGFLIPLLFLPLGWCHLHNEIIRTHNSVHSYTFSFMPLLEKGGPFAGPKSGLLSNTQKWIFQGDSHAEKARDFIVNGQLGREQQCKRTWGNCSAMWLTVFGLASRFSLANHSGSGSFLVVCALLSQEAFQWDGFWEVGRTRELVSSLPFCLFQVLPVGGSLLVLHSLTGPPVLR